MSNIEPILRLATGIFLAFISMILTVGLFLSLAGDNFTRQIVMVSLAIGLEAAKILTFRMGKSFKAISISLIAISVLASFGSALLVVESDKTTSMIAAQAGSQSTYQYKSSLAEVESLDTQINVLVGRLNSLPSDFITAGKEISSSIATLRESRAKALKGLTQVPAASVASLEAPTTMFGLFSRLSRINEGLIILILLLFLAIMLEISILALIQNNPTLLQTQNDLSYSQPEMSYPDSPKNGVKTAQKKEGVSIPGIKAETPPTVSYEPVEADFNPEIFLKAMIDSETYPILRGRDATAQLLGIPAYKAKVIVTKLLQEGKIKVEGKRLVMCGTVLRPDSEHSTNMEARERII